MRPAGLLLVAAWLSACAPEPDPVQVDAGEPAELRRAEQALSTDPAQVASALADFHPTNPAQRCRAGALRARAAVRVSTPAEAEPLLAAALQGCPASAGRPKVRSDLAGTLAWLRLVGLRDVPGAEAALAEMADAVQAWPAGAAPLRYYRALLAAELRDWRGARPALAEALALAERFEDERVRWAAGALAADVDAQLGDHEAAIERLRGLAEQASGCHRATLQNNLAWALLGAPMGSDGAAKGRLAEARSVLETAVSAQACRPGLRANAWTTLARVRLDAGDHAAAAEALAKAKAALPTPEPHVGLWQDELAARLTLAAGRRVEAAGAFAALATRARGLLDPIAEWRALAGRAEALDGPAAAQAYREAEAALAAVGRAIPIADGHHRFYGDRAGFVGRYADALVASGDPAAAAAAVRRHRRRAVAQVALRGRLARLSGARRQAWLAGLQRYRTLRAEVTAGAAKLALLDRASRRAKQATLDAKSAQAQTALESAYEAAGADPGQAALPPVGAHTLTLVLTSRRVFALDPSGARATVPWDGDGARLLAALDGMVAAVGQVRVLAGGAMGDVDVHAWPWRGQPLGLARPVVYGLDLDAAPAAGEGAVVLSDPRGDLPAARAEGRWVAQALGAVHTHGAEATLAAAQAALAARRLHFAGHGLVDVDSPLEGALALAGGARLTVADILAAPQVPHTVVLSGCETARAAGRDVVVGLGLAQAFLAAGSAAVVAASRPVDDALAATFMRAWYEARAQVGAGPALMQAWQATRAAHPRGDWAAFRLVTR